MSDIRQSLPIDLLTLYKNQAVNNIAAFCSITEQLDAAKLVTAYKQLRESAPHRHKHNRRYFVDHTGITTSKKDSNRREEHLAIALWNYSQQGNELVMPDGRNLRVLDYQFPLKAQQADKGVGKLDLFGRTSDARACVLELKINPVDTGRGDTPLRAYLEALAYCAIVAANTTDIAAEVSERFDLKLSVTQPLLIVVAPEKYWAGYVDHHKSGAWWSALKHLADQVDTSLGLESHFLALRESNFSMGLEGQKPLLADDCTLVSLAEFIQQQENSES